MDWSFLKYGFVDLLIIREFPPIIGLMTAIKSTFKEFDLNYFYLDFF
jgi:hypothetical protein